MDDEKKDTMRVDNGASGTRTIKVDYPGNSHKYREEEKKEPKEVRKVIRGNAVKRKKTFGEKLKNTFFGEDVDSVFLYIIQDVLVPAAKSTLSDMVSGGIEMLLFGDSSAKGGRRSERGGRSYVSYSNYYKNDRDRDRRDERREPSLRNRSRHNFDDIVLDTRNEAIEVRECLIELVEKYGIASVADLYDLVGITSNHTDTKYGWDNLRNSDIHRVRDGYVLSLPRPILLD